ncbi:MAG: hypothetical protein HRU30_01860 [Rhodobacteraceae bacterium]|nr:hypothetical protein [Paracoccaceae bacterium]
MLTRFALALALLLPTAAFANQEKETACALQGDMVAQIQQARLDRVSKAKVVPKLMAANPSWPASVETAMPGLVNWIYEQRRRDLRNVALGPAVQQQCLDNWDQIKQLSGS